MKTKMRQADKLWIAGGSLAAVALAALSYLLLISPQNTETTDLQAEIDGVNTQVALAQARIAQLRKDNEQLGEYKATLDAQRQALPTSTALSDFLRQMQDAGEQTRVSVTSVNAGTAGEVTAAGASIRVLPVTLTVTGSANGQIAFLDQLQQTVPRAVLIIGANLVPGDTATSLADDVTMSLTVQIFVAPDPVTAGTGASPAADPAASAPAQAD